MNDLAATPAATSPTSTPQPGRTPTAVDVIAEEHVARTCKLSPQFATVTGLGDGAGRLDDPSPEGLARFDELSRATLHALETVAPVDDVDRVTIAAMRERLGLELELSDAGENLRSLNNITSTPQDLRDFFDLVPTSTIQDWEHVASALANVPRALAGYTESLRLAASRGNVAAARQIRAVIAQAADQADPATSSYSQLVAGAQVDATDLPTPLAGRLEEAAISAREAYAELARFLTEELALQAEETDAVGRERYSRFSRTFLGATVDLDETYEWGRERLAAIDAEQRGIAEELFGPGTSVREALERLNRDPARLLHGTAARACCAAGCGRGRVGL